MKFKGLILLLIRDSKGIVHHQKKRSQHPAELEQYLQYINTIEKQLGDRLIKSFVINLEDPKRYVWSSYTWRKDVNNKISPNHQKYIDYLSENKKGFMFIGPYKSMRTKGLHLCPKGHEWNIQPIQVKEGVSCPKCKMKGKESNGAKFITNFLTSNKVEFIKEVPIDRFGFSENYRMDFLICKNNHPLFFIEFNGVQHYKLIRNDFFGSYKGFKERNSRDRYKRDCCWKIGIPVIDIPYTETEEQMGETIIYFLKLFEIYK
ncbi:hypothetical protein AWM68_17390 [Fictibacillus phosphorivorans]|uniref:Uncharacterized protein n=1 Tax=Fictibacillus phosphorivorans TaxID=1221500 RepID=A0A161RUL9_9BACL|nr:DUF2726 domain-containing protein [Fictibacillus phosphorivorans]KZE67946.1 hypothetical protein AWM68_17390 [Fictibacillus phosphorivorans]